MLRASLRSLLSRKLRLFLSVLAVVLGVAFVSGTYVLTDTLKSTFTSLFSNAYSHVDAAVQSKAAFNRNGQADREPLSESILDTVRSVPGVAEATGTASGYAQLVGKNGKPIHNGGAPPIGISWTNSSLQPVKLLSGAPPVGGFQVAVDEKVAKQHHLAVGDHIKVLLAGPSRNVTITGIFRFASGGSLAGATLTAFDLPTAQQVYDLKGKYDTVLVKAAPGISQSELLTRIGAALPKSAEVLTGHAFANQQSSQITDNLSFFNTFLLAVGFIALFVAAFIIANTFQMLVAQRVRELALMRAVGASRRQVNRSVQFEAFLVGLFGSTVGLILGVLLAIGLKALLGLFGADIPSNGLVFKPRTAIVAYAIGILVTMAAAFLPARKAGRVPPVAAMRESWVEPQKPLRSRTLLGLGALVVGVAALVTGVDGAGILLVVVGVALVFGGVISLSPMLSSPVVRLLGGPLSRLYGVTGKLAEENALRNPRRTAATASALMVGVALVAAFAVMGDSLKTSFHAIFRAGLTADYVLRPDQQGSLGFSTSVAATLQTTPGVTTAAGITGGPAEINGSVKSLEAIDPVALPQVLNLKTLSGDLAGIGQDKIAISKTVADNKHYKVGQVLNVRFAKTGVQHMVVSAVYKKNTLAGDYLISRDYAHRNFTQSLDFVVLANAEGGVSPAAQANIKRAVSAFPNVKVQTQAQYLHDQDKTIDQILTLIIVLLLLAIVIALLGIVNTLALSIVERTREIGLLRAVGMDRKQLRRSIRLEAGIIATYGAILGLVVGIGFGWAIFRALRSQGIDNFSVPIGMLIIALILAAVAGTLAAVWPARRAAKLDVLEAIATT